MFTRAMLIGDDLVEVPDHSHAAFIMRTGRDGLRLRLYPEGIAVNLAALVAPEVFPAAVPDPATDRETMIQQIKAWLRACPPVRARYPAGCQISWYL